MTWIHIARGRAPVGFWCLAAIVAAMLAPAHARAQFRLGLDDPGFRTGSSKAQGHAALGAMHAIDGSVVRVSVYWATVAPTGTAAPAGFHASDPADPHYRWAATDYAVRLAARHHLKVLLVFLDAPVWAQGHGRQSPYASLGAWEPNPTEFAAFVHAAAVRYGGDFADPRNAGAKLPRVKYWEAWNEPNIPGYFAAPDPVPAYRTLLNSAYDAIKAVHHDNLVALGGLAPISPVPGSTAPLDFGAQLLCLQRAGGGFRADRSCPVRTKFDVFAMHPYSLAATPTKHAYKRGDVLVGDIGTLGAMVRAADRLHTTATRGRHQLWVTEFAWITNPPNPQLGDSGQTAARYVAYSMYEMWKSGVSLVIWQLVLDVRNAGFGGGSGLYTSAGQPKLTAEAFGFPVVASVRRGRGFVWGRVPVSHRARVVVQVARGHRWKKVAALRTGSDGVFVVRFRARGNGVYRAHLVGGATSLPYDSRPIPPKRTHAFSAH